MRKIYHALTLNLHQPPGNLQWLLDNNEWGQGNPPGVRSHAALVRIATHAPMPAEKLESWGNPPFEAVRSRRKPFWL